MRSQSKNHSLKINLIIKAVEYSKKQMRDRQRDERNEYAMRALHKAGFKPKMCNPDIGHIQIGYWNFWSRTGKIFNPMANEKLPEDIRGINNFIKILKKARSRNNL